MLTLGIDWQARATLDYFASSNALMDIKAMGVDASSSAIYNGRERWVSVEFRGRRDGECFVVKFGEHRRSDSLCVEWTTRTAGLNPATTDDFSEDTYERRRFFSCGHVWDAVALIGELVKTWEESAPT